MQNIFNRQHQNKMEDLSTKGSVLIDANLPSHDLGYNLLSEAEKYYALAVTETDEEKILERQEAFAETFPDFQSFLSNTDFEFLIGGNVELHSMRANSPEFKELLDERSHILKHFQNGYPNSAVQSDSGQRLTVFILDSKKVLQKKVPFGESWENYDEYSGELSGGDVEGNEPVRLNDFLDKENIQGSFAVVSQNYNENVGPHPHLETRNLLN